FVSGSKSSNPADAFGREPDIRAHWHSTGQRLTSDAIEVKIVATLSRRLWLTRSEMQAARERL
ncbi:hypothetical protein, partial [Pseudomonas sp. UBA3149]|uniref:hypothetical protein n=1 Tax=Pseudomonas sp. UBA3149 TaxID=1947312 RepID=UPI00257B3911